MTGYSLTELNGMDTEEINNADAEYEGGDTPGSRARKRAREAEAERKSNMSEEEAERKFGGNTNPAGR